MSHRIPAILAGVLVLSSSHLAMAAGKPVLIESVDEPARAPYQEAVQASSAFAGDVALVFTPVPAGTRRVVEHITCELSTSGVTNVPFVLLFSQAFRNPRNFVPLSSDGSGTEFFNDAATLAYYEAGEVPRADIFVNAATTNSFWCTLIGHDITLP